jgi:hypothetical protein
MRLRQIAVGNRTADEMFLMLTEKIDAATKARSIFLRGGDCNRGVEHYRKIVLANVERLSGVLRPVIC